MKAILVDRCRNCPYVKHITEDLWYCTLRTYKKHNVAVMVDPDSIPNNCPLLNLKDIKNSTREAIMNLRLRRAIFVYEGTRLQAKMLKCLVIPKKWEDREENFKNQFMDLVNDLIEGKRKFKNFEEVHDSWVKKYLNMGWRYGRKYDPKKRTHPDLVPYSKLDPKEKIKDEVFLNFVKIAKRYL